MTQTEITEMKHALLQQLDQNLRAFETNVKMAVEEALEAERKEIIAAWTTTFENLTQKIQGQ